MPDSIPSFEDFKAQQAQAIPSFEDFKRQQGQPPTIKPKALGTINAMMGATGGENTFEGDDPNNPYAPHRFHMAGPMSSPMMQGVERMAEPGLDAKAKGASMLIRGAGQAEAPLLIPAAMAAPAATAAALGGGALGSTVGGGIASAVHAPEGVQDLSEDAGGIVGGGLASRIPAALADVPWVGDLARWGTKHFAPGIAKTPLNALIDRFSPKAPAPPPYVAPPPIKPMMNGSTVTDRIASAQGPKASIPPIRPMQNGPGAPQPISKPLAPIPPIRPMNRLVPEPELGPKAPIPPLRPMSKAEPVATGPKAPIPPLRYPNKPVASAKPQPTVTSPKTEVSPETQSLFDRSTPEYQPKPSSGSSLSPHAQQVYDSLDKMGDDAPHSIRELQSKNPDIPRPELEKALLELRNKRMAYGSVSDQKLPPEHAVTNPDNPTQQFVGFSKRFDTEPPTIASAKPQATVVQPSKGQAIPGEDNRPLRAVRDYRGGQDEQGYGETTEENTNRSSNAQRAWNILKKEGWTAKDLRDESNQSDLMDLLKANAKNISVRKIKPEAYVPSPETLEAIRTLAETEEKR